MFRHITILAALSVCALCTHAGSANDVHTAVRPALKELKDITYIKETKDGLGSREVADIVFDGKRTWFATRRGLYLKEGKKWRRFTDLDGLPTLNLLRLADDGDTLWIGGVGGLSKLDKKTLKIEWMHLRLPTISMRADWIKEKRDQFDQVVLSIAVDGDDIWVGTPTGAGIYNKKTGKSRPMRYTGDWRGDDYLDIVVDKDEIFAATTYVFANLNKRSGDWDVRLVCTESHKFIMGAHDVLVTNDFIWLPCRQGLARFDRKKREMGIYIFHGTDPYLYSDSACNWFKLCQGVLDEEQKDPVMKYIAAQVPDDVKDQMLTYVNRTKAFVAKDGYSIPPVPRQSIVDALAKPIGNPKLIPDNAVEAHRGLTDEEKKRKIKQVPERVLDPNETALMKKVRAGKASPLEVAHFNRQAIRRICNYKGSFPPYTAPKQGTLSGKTLFANNGSGGALLPENIVPILGQNMSDSWCWSAVAVGDDIWVGTENGITVMNAQTGAARFYRKDSGLLDSRVARIFYDGKNIWACTRWGINIFPAKQ